MPGSYQVTPAILGRRRATQRITVTPASKPGRPTASYRVSPPPARGPTSRVGRHRPSARDPDTEAGYPTRPPGGDGHPVPVSRRVSATSIRFSVIRFPPRSWALLAVGLPQRVHGHAPDLDRVTAFRTRELRPGWLPSLPRGRRCSSRPEGVPGPAPAASQRPVLSSPPPAIRRRGPLDEASTRVQAIQPSGLPLAWRLRTERKPLGLSPSFAPRRPRADDARRGGDRPSSTDLELHAQHHISRSSNRAFTHYVRPRVAPPDAAVRAMPGRLLLCLLSGVRG